jgi:hypothetical protein
MGGRADHRFDGQPREVAAQGDERLAAAALVRISGQPQGRPVPRKMLRVRDVREEVFARGADDPVALDDNDKRRERRTYAASSLRTRWVPATIAASFATVSSVVRVLSPQSGDT